MWETRPPASITKNAAAHINLCPENAVHEGLDWLIQTRESCLREPVHLVRHKPIELPIGDLPVYDESKYVSFVLPGPALVWKTVNRRVWQRDWRIYPLLKRPRTSVIVNDINITQAYPDKCKIKTLRALINYPSKRFSLQLKIRWLEVLELKGLYLLRKGNYGAKKL